ncbi:hypothetical protein [Burkholderia diffusa]|uniref:hypothetical protein n=1 Tax=Burkholderia diffusa TaxID=488732 RepID=UPI002AB1EE03|nr:hypothetical protein [Burkholderia diffusa]
MLEFLFTSIPYAQVYNVAKDIKAFFEWVVKDKLVDGEWLEKSGFQKQSNAEGIELRWVNAERVASAELDEWAILYELDKPNRIRHKLIRKGQEVPTLMGKQQKVEGS